MENIIDARGLSCPQPLIMATKAFKSFDSFQIIVDHEVPKENICRVLMDKYSVKAQVTEQGDEFVISIKK